MVLFLKVPKVQLYNIFSTILFLNLGMLLFLSTYEINLKLGVTYVDDMLNFQENQRPVTCCLGTLIVTTPNSEKCILHTDCR